MKIPGIITLRKFQIFRNFSPITKFSVCGKLMKNLKFFPLLPEGKIKIHLKTKRNLKTLKLGHNLEFLP